MPNFIAVDAHGNYSWLSHARRSRCRSPFITTFSVTGFDQLKSAGRAFGISEQEQSIYQFGDARSTMSAIWHMSSIQLLYNGDLKI